MRTVVKIKYVGFDLIYTRSEIHIIYVFEVLRKLCGAICFDSIDHPATDVQALRSCSILGPVVYMPSTSCDIPRYVTSVMIRAARYESPWSEKLR